jgi:hypothetical protein
MGDQLLVSRSSCWVSFEEFVWMWKRRVLRQRMERLLFEGDGQELWVLFPGLRRVAVPSCNFFFPGVNNL